MVFLDFHRFQSNKRLDTSLIQYTLIDYVNKKQSSVARNSSPYSPTVSPTFDLYFKPKQVIKTFHL